MATRAGQSQANLLEFDPRAKSKNTNFACDSTVGTELIM
jgi:hypothetical protein